ncbi:MAG: FAD-binding oxidoreductase [Sulfuritalea sp.]|nr:FAD-binding oxidoreductase [Sulfuritalea sp.]
MRADFIVIGGGIAGASAAYWLAPYGRVVVLERESQPGYHSTGRSAALYAQSYGTPLVRAVTRASRPFYESPPPGFAEHPILSPRGVMFIGEHGQQDMLEAMLKELSAVDADIQAIDGAEVCRRVPVIKPEWVVGAVLDQKSMDMDVNELHQGYLRGVRRQGGEIIGDADVCEMSRRDGDWQIRTTGGGSYSAPVVANAAGAWCDAIAELAGVSTIGLVPKRRTAFTFHPPSELDIHSWPAVVGVDESFYFKPDAGMLLGSPANADPVPPHDVQAEELDVATGIYHIEAATTLQIRRPARVWAGLRSFVSDGDLVAGFDTSASGFFWIAAQGGYGIQSANAMGRLSAALMRGEAIPEDITSEGVSVEALSPGRLRMK